MHSIIGIVLCFSEFHTENPETSDFPLVQMLAPVRPGGVFNHGFPLFVILFGGGFPLFKQETQRRIHSISENAGPLFSTRIYPREKWWGLFDNCSCTPQAEPLDQTGKTDSCILVYPNWNGLRIDWPFNLVPLELWRLFDFDLFLFVLLGHEIVQFRWDIKLTL